MLYNRNMFKLQYIQMLEYEEASKITGREGDRQ